MIGTVGAAVAGLFLGLAAGALVTMDADRIGMGAATHWGALVAVTVGIAMALAPLGFVPVPGLLAMGALGPAFYLLERDDTRQGDTPADPHTLDGPAKDGTEPEDEQ